MMNTVKISRQKLLHVFIIIWLCIFQTGTIYAQKLSVTKFEDTNDGICDADCSLREAISYANSTPEDDYIKLQSGTYYIEIPIVFTSSYKESDFEWEIELRKHEDANQNGDFDILTPLTIVGASDGTTIINGQYLDRIFDILSGSTILKHLTLTSGGTRNYGGALRNQSTVTIWNCIIQSSRASATYVDGIGGGIANFGTMLLYASLIKNNDSSAGEGSFGRGGGIYNEGTLYMRESIVDGNRAIDDRDSGSGGGLFNFGVADIRRSLFLKNEADYTGQGSAFFNAGELKLYSSTIADNYAENDGSAIFNGEAIRFDNSWKNYGGNLDIFSSTITNNKGGGLRSISNTRVKNSIIAGNFDNEMGYEESLVSRNCMLENYNGHYFFNVIFGRESNTSCLNSGEEVMMINNDDVFVTVIYPAPQKDGEIWSYSIRPGSMAIDTGRFPCPTVDQNRNLAPIDGDGDGVALCDIGSVEYIKEP